MSMWSGSQNIREAVNQTFYNSSVQPDLEEIYSSGWLGGVQRSWQRRKCRVILTTRRWLKQRLNLKDKKRKNVKGIVSVSSPISFWTGANELKTNTRITTYSFFMQTQPRGWNEHSIYVQTFLELHFIWTICAGNILILSCWVNPVDWQLTGRVLKEADRMNLVINRLDSLVICLFMQSS